MINPGTPTMMPLQGSARMIWSISLKRTFVSTVFKGDATMAVLSVTAMPVRLKPQSNAIYLAMGAIYTCGYIPLKKNGMENSILKDIIEKTWLDRDLLQSTQSRDAIAIVMERLDKGELRCASPDGNGGWEVNDWVKKAVVLNFPIQKMETIEVGPFEFHDKMPLKKGFAEAGVRVVPHAVARYGSYIAKDVILMPSYINLGAYVDSGTMVDTWATVGSCAQIGKEVHLSGGVGIGGVLEPLQASPVIIEDGAFIGSRCIVVEGVRVGTEAVLGAGVVLTQSTLIIDVTGDKPVELRGYVPPRSVVIPGTRPKKFPAGTFNIPCAFIIGKRKESTNRKTSLNSALREHNVAV
jgi:2,3,4,5-tetrahydropyridine-2-carboxylate N-succinyltransferase